MQKPSRLLTEERRREILGMLDQNGRITVDEVAKRFGVSAVTARSDLDALSESGSLIRSHGGGIKPLTATPEHPLRVRQEMRHQEKVRIGQAAAAMIEPLQTVILCTGSTSCELAREIRQNPPKNITVITYALNIAMLLAENPSISLVMLGGILRHTSTAFVGPQAEQTMHSLHADHCFLSTVGLDTEVGLTTLDIMEAQLNRRMIESSAEVTVLADSSKFGRRSLSLIADWRHVRRVITDTGAPEADVERLCHRGVDVIRV
jgi:DeoR/GlpR family transcriptional regulator of sugar metabolism